MRHTQPSNAQRARNALTRRSLERFATSGRKYAANRQNARRHGLAVAVADDPARRSQGAQSNQLFGSIIPPPCSQTQREGRLARRDPQRHRGRTAPEELAVSCVETCRRAALGAAHLRKTFWQNNFRRKQQRNQSMEANHRQEEKGRGVTCKVMPSRSRAERPPHIPQIAAPSGLRRSRFRQTRASRGRFHSRRWL